MAELILPSVQLSPAMVVAELDYRLAFDAWSAALKDASAATFAQAVTARRRLHKAELDLRDAEAALAGATSLVLRQVALGASLLEGSGG